jgi:hypothetical protein
MTQVPYPFLPSGTPLMLRYQLIVRIDSQFFFCYPHRDYLSNQFFWNRIAIGLKSDDRFWTDAS